MRLVIGYLYSDYMNIYGDSGNITTLKKRTEWRGIDVSVKKISIGDILEPGDVDLFFFGGGQDQAQELVAKDLVVGNKGKILRKEVARGVPLLAICGGYQLLGEYYRPHGAPKLAGVGLFSAYTVAGDQRMIGNIVISSHFGYLVGFENHSGKTYLRKGAKPLGTVVSGFGNNGEDGMEGCVHNNAIGCYMHGSLLPKNPELADWMIQTSLEVKYGKKVELQPLDDKIELAAHKKAIHKFS